jgi:outer membrane lipoprotein-sorting protein
LKKPCFIPAAALFIGLVVSFATCQEATLLSRVAKNYSGDVSLSTSFDVKIFWKIREKEETKHGTIVMAQHDRFRIRLGESEWVSDGTTLWQYDRAPSPQVIIRLLASCDPSQVPSRMLSGYLARYSFKEEETKGKNTVFAWASDSSPAAPSAGDASRITFTVAAKSAAVQKLDVVDKSGNVSTYTFHGTTFGPPPPSAFSFDVPKGARVLDERQ